jgi:hypothetical protein
MVESVHLACLVGQLQLSTSLVPDWGFIHLLPKWLTRWHLITGAARASPYLSPYRRRPTRPVKVGSAHRNPKRNVWVATPRIRYAVPIRSGMISSSETCCISRGRIGTDAQLQSLPRAARARAPDSFCFSRGHLTPIRGGHLTPRKIEDARTRRGSGLSTNSGWTRSAAGLRAAADSGSGDRRFESFRPSQSAEQRTGDR